jgi:hypothetical protein
MTPFVGGPQAFETTSVRSAENNGRGVLHGGLCNSFDRSLVRAPVVPSVARHKDCNVSSFLRARLTFSRMSLAVAVQMKGLGSSL